MSDGTIAVRAVALGGHNRLHASEVGTAMSYTLQLPTHWC